MSQENEFNNEENPFDQNEGEENSQEASGEKPETNYWDKTTMHVFDEVEGDSQEQQENNDDSVQEMAGRIATDSLGEDLPKPVMPEGGALSPADDDEDFSDIFTTTDDLPFSMPKPGVPPQAQKKPEPEPEEKPKAKKPPARSKWETTFVSKEEVKEEVVEEEEEVFSTRIVENSIPLTEIYKNGDLPRSIELLLKKGIVAPEFRRRIYENPVAAAEGVMLPLTPEDREILKSTDDMQLSMVMNMLEIHKEEKKDLGGNDLTGLYMKPPPEDEPEEEEQPAEEAGEPAAEETAAEDEPVEAAAEEQASETEETAESEDEIFKAQDRIATEDESRKETMEWPSQEEEAPASEPEQTQPEETQAEEDAETAPETEPAEEGETVDVLYLFRPSSPEAAEDTIEVLMMAQGIDRDAAKELLGQDEIRVATLTGRPESIVRMLMGMINGFDLKGETRKEPAKGGSVAAPVMQQTASAFGVKPREETAGEEDVTVITEGCYPVISPPMSRVADPADLESVFRITMENPRDDDLLKDGLELICDLTGLGLGDFAIYQSAEMIPVADVRSLDYGKKVAALFIEKEIHLKVEGRK